MIGKRIAALLVIIICVVVLLLSYMNWKDKLVDVTTAEGATIAEELSGIANTEGELVANDEIEIHPQGEVTLTEEDIDQLTATMDEDIAALLKRRFAEEKTIRMLIVGSQAIGQGGEGGMAGLTASFLDESYKGFIKTDIISVSGTSKEFIESMEDLIDWDAGYDLLLLEPFTLNNNGKVVIEAEHRHILELRDQLLLYKEDAELIVMPPQPIFRPKFYLTQIRSLGKFTEAKSIPYINHWEQWPDPASEGLLTFLGEDSAPNDLGAAAWAAAVDGFFGADE